MKPYDLEVAAYAAAHRIANGLPIPDRATPGGYRSAMVDEIASEIKSAFSVHLERDLTGLALTHYWREFQHPFHAGGGTSTDHPCLNCGLPATADIHVCLTWRGSE